MEELPITVLSRYGKEKVIIPSTSDDEAEPIDAELEAVAARVTRTLAVAKHLLDIITAITTEGQEAMP